MRKLFVVGGTWEFTPYGLQQDIVNRINKGWQAEWIPYPARYGDGEAYMISVDIGKRNLNDAINRWGGEYSITGYSQGAKIAGDISKERLTDGRFLRSYLIADPSRSPKDRLIGPKVGGKGISGEREVGWKANEFVAPGDFIGSNDNAFLYNVARYTYNMSSRDPVAWIKSFSNAAKEREAGGDVVAGFRTLADYLRTQVHTRYPSYVVQDGLTTTQWIAKDLNRWS